MSSFDLTVFLTQIRPPVLPSSCLTQPWTPAFLSYPSFWYGQVDHLSLPFSVSTQSFIVDNFNACWFSFKCVKIVLWFCNKNIQIAWCLISMYFIDICCYFTIPLYLVACFLFLWKPVLHHLVYLFQNYVLNCFYILF